MAVFYVIIIILEAVAFSLQSFFSPKSVPTCSTRYSCRVRATTITGHSLTGQGELKIISHGS